MCSLAADINCFQVSSHLVPLVLLPALHGSGAASAATFALDLI